MLPFFFLCCGKSCCYKRKLFAVCSRTLLLSAPLSLSTSELSSGPWWWCAVFFTGHPRRFEPGAHKSHLRASAYQPGFQKTFQFIFEHSNKEPPDQPLYSANTENMRSTISCVPSRHIGVKNVIYRLLKCVNVMKSTFAIDCAGCTVITIRHTVRHCELVDQLFSAKRFGVVEKRTVQAQVLKCLKIHIITNSTLMTVLSNRSMKPSIKSTV